MYNGFYKMENHPQSLPIGVVFEKSLLRTSLFWETTFSYLKQYPWKILMFLIWMVQGKKRVLARFFPYVHIDWETLPMHQENLKEIHQLQQQGKELWLITNYPEYANQYQQVAPLFSRVIPSEKIDSNDAYTPLHLPSPDSYFSLSAYMQALRVHQWLKNALIFVPVIASHQIEQTELLVNSVLAFFSFSLCASSVYLFNDLSDLPDDRRHHSKKNRPFAAGKLPLQHGVVLIPILIFLASLLSVSLPLQFQVVLAVYFLLTFLYSLYVKPMILADVLLLSALYTIRIIAGGAAASIVLSFWLLGFSIFLFFSLALLKRYTELEVLQRSEQKYSRGRGYRVSDMSLLQNLGITSGYLSILILALYLNSTDVTLRYLHPERLWLLCPFMLYWISRIWLIAHRGEMTDDPLEFAIYNRGSQVTMGAMTMIVLFAM